MFILFVFLSINWIVSSKSPALHRIVVVSVLIEATQPTLGTNLIEVFPVAISNCGMLLGAISSERSSGCPCLLGADLIEVPTVATGHCGLLPGAVSSEHSLCCPLRAPLFLHGLNFLFSASLFEVGLLAILTDVFAFVDILCKRQYLCSRRSRKMVIQVDFSLSCRITIQPSTLCPVSRTPLCLLAYGSRCLPHHVCCVLRMYYASCGKLFVALQLFPLPRSRVKRNGIERYLICWLLVALRIFPASAPPWQAPVSKRNQVRWWCATLTLTK